MSASATGLVKYLIVLSLLAAGSGLVPDTVLAFEGQINLNTASQKELESLPFIGEAKARAIIRYRQHKGPFATVDDLRQVSEIGDETVQAIRPYLTLTGASTPPPAKSKPSATNWTQAPPFIQTQAGEVRLLTDQQYYPALQGLIAHATSSIDMSMFVFKTTEAASNRAAALVQDLIAARQRGVAVTLLLEKSGYDPKLNEDNQKVAARLKKGGVTVRFDSEKTTTHAKIVVVDRRYSLVGSHNFTSSALSFNHEATLLVDSEALAAQLLTYMRGIR